MADGVDPRRQRQLPGQRGRASGRVPAGEAAQRAGRPSADAPHRRPYPSRAQVRLGLVAPGNRDRPGDRRGGRRQALCRQRRRSRIPGPPRLHPALPAGAGGDARLRPLDASADLLLPRHHRPLGPAGARRPSAPVHQGALHAGEGVAALPRAGAHRPRLDGQGRHDHADARWSGCPAAGTRSASRATGTSASTSCSCSPASSTPPSCSRRRGCTGSCPPMRRSSPPRPPARSPI